MTLVELVKERTTESIIVLLGLIFLLFFLRRGREKL